MKKMYGKYYVNDENVEEKGNRGTPIYKQVHCKFYLIYIVMCNLYLSATLREKNIMSRFSNRQKYHYFFFFYLFSMRSEIAKRILTYIGTYFTVFIASI